MNTRLLKDYRAHRQPRHTTLLLLAAALWLLAGGPFTQARAQSAQPVQWVNLVNATANGNSVSKTSGEWEAGANSAQQISANGCYVEFKVSMNQRIQVGLSNDLAGNANYTLLKYTFNFWGTEFDIREGWENMRLWGGAYAAGDVFRIAIEGGAVRYYRNGALLYASGVAPTYPLVLDAALHSMGATVQDAYIANSSAQAVILDGDDGAIVQVPATTAYTALGDFEIAFRLREPSIPANSVRSKHVFSPRANFAVSISPDGGVIGVWDGTKVTTEDAYVPTSTRTYFRVRHISATGQTTFEGWDADGGNYQIGRSQGRAGTFNLSGELGFGRSLDPWDGDTNLRARVDWLRWRGAVGPEGVRPSDFNLDFNLLRWEFDGNRNDSGPAGLHLPASPTPQYEASPAAERVTPIARADDRTAKPNTVVTLDASASASSEGGATYTWTQTEGPPPASISGQGTPTLTLTTPTPAGDRACLVFDLTVSDAGGSSTTKVYVGVVQTGPNDEVIISDQKVARIVGPQLMHGSPYSPHPKLDEIALRRGRAHGELFPKKAPHTFAAGTAQQHVAVGVNSRTVSGVGVDFREEIEMDPLVASDYRARMRIRDSAGVWREVVVESIQSETSLTIKDPWPHAAVTQGAADTRFGDNGFSFNTWYNYYDLGYTLYIEYYRTGNTRYQKLAQKVADVWWGADSNNFGGPVCCGLGPRMRDRSAAGLILRALDGKPEYWDGIERGIRDGFDSHIKNHINDPVMFLDIREAGYAQLYAVMLSFALPDAYTAYAQGTNNPRTGPVDGVNGQTKRDGFVADTNAAATNYFARFQRPDGSWRWDNTDFNLVDDMQPFMVGIYMEAAVLQHQVVADAAVKANLEDQIVRACRHLKGIWRTGVVPDLPGNIRWRGHWYFYHGGTTTNPTLLQNGGGFDSNGVPTALFPSTTGGSPSVVSEQRHLNSEIQHALGYAYRLTGDPAMKAHGDDMLEANFGGSDGIYALADTPGKPKDYNMYFRGAGRYLAWRLRSPNPIGGTDYFVRQHYLDFLGREADAPGLAHWTNVIESCGADAQCREVTRVNVSAAFFLSIEFQQTGFLVYRAYGAAFGTTRVGGKVPLTRTEFLPDAEALVRDVVVNTPGWETRLETNKVEFFKQFVTRAPFVAAFPASITPTAFVDKLHANAGGDILDAAERTNLIDELTAGGNSNVARASVLRKVAEDGSFVDAHRNKAFVLMQYLGYLRRDPNAPPDSDFAGYNHWLTHLNSFNGNFEQAEMVKAFLSSAEYRRRFGPN
jgi:hypothetical protein